MRAAWIGVTALIVVALIGVFAVINRPDFAPSQPSAPRDASTSRPVPAPNPSPALVDPTISLEFDGEDYEGLVNEGHGEVIVDVWIGDSHGKLCAGLNCGGLPSSSVYKLPEGTLDYRIEGTENEDTYPFVGIEGRENEVTNKATPVGGSGTIEVRDGRNILLEMEGSSAVVRVTYLD